MFVDHIRIYAKAGDGGAGSSSFRRETFVPRGGPDGGDGGQGGSVVLRADPQTDSLTAFFYEPKIVVPDGHRGMKKQMSGKASPHKVVPVPVGTLVYRLPEGEGISSRLNAAGVFDAATAEVDDGAPRSAHPTRRPAPDTSNLELLADLRTPGQEFVLRQGGRGGKGNVHFKSARNQAPTRADPGEEGEEGYFLLELRLIADVGLVGYPNAGKSTLLAALSAARPKVAAYPFTTLHPLIGVVEFPGTYQRITVADIPGLIEGAHRNVGLGHEFLRHVTRCRLLLFVLDMAGSENRSPLEDFASVRRELSLYDPTLVERPTLVVANKMDLAGAEENLRLFRERFGRFDILPITAGEGRAGVQPLLAALVERFEVGKAVTTQEPGTMPE